MPEILGDSGLYFDPEDLQSISNTLQKLKYSPDLRKKLANVSHALVEHYNWKKFADTTFQFLSDVVVNYKSKQ